MHKQKEFDFIFTCDAYAEPTAEPNAMRKENASDKARKSNKRICKVNANANPK